MREKLKRLAAEDEGPTSIEYALLAMLIAMAIIAAVTVIGQRLSVPFNTVANALWVS